MKYFIPAWQWFKGNWAILFLALFFSIYVWTQAKKIETVTEKMTKEMSISRYMDQQAGSKAVYMPGSNCVIRATPDVSKQLFMDLAMSCARKHEEYLLSLKENDEKAE